MTLFRAEYAMPVIAPRQSFFLNWTSERWARPEGYGVADIVIKARPSLIK
jgi:hypothetical protein